MSSPSEIQIEYIVYGVLGTVIAGAIGIWGALFKKARADKADRTEIYKYINDENDKLSKEVKDMQDKYADVREQLGFIKGVQSVIKK